MEPKLPNLGQIFKTSAPPAISLEDGMYIVEKYKLPQTFNFPDPRCIVGIEIEVENVKSIDPNVLLGFWRMIQDGSLRNNGQEFVSVPIPSCFIEPALHHVFAGLNDTAEFTSRTSIHVHLNARTFTPEQLCTFVMTYLVIENLLFKYAGNNRRSNIYCVPIQDTSIFDKVPGEWGPKTIHTIQEYWSKYTALNLLPLSKLGTVEFRHMPGTRDIKKILVWIAMIQQLKLFAFKNNHKDVVSLISGLNTNSQYRIFLDNVLGEYYHYLDLSNLQVDMEGAVTLVKQCGMVNEFHQKVLKNVSFTSSYAKYLSLDPKVAAKKKKQYAVSELLLQPAMQFSAGGGGGGAVSYGDEP